LRFTDNRICVGCSTGKSAGFAPSRTFFTKFPPSHDASPEIIVIEDRIRPIPPPSYPRSRGHDSTAAATLGHSRPSWSKPTFVFIRCYSNSGQNGALANVHSLFVKTQRHSSICSYPRGQREGQAMVNRPGPNNRASGDGGCAVLKATFAKFLRCSI
jgi:hypothetical protein